jgi:hypothetical protein
MISYHNKKKYGTLFEEIFIQYYKNPKLRIQITKLSKVFRVLRFELLYTRLNSRNVSFQILQKISTEVSGNAK